MRILLIPLLLAVLACSRVEPPPSSTPGLESLRSSEFEPDFALMYWTERFNQRARSAEWSRAIAFCELAQVERYPNCRTVRLVASAAGLTTTSTELTHD